MINAECGQSVHVKHRPDDKMFARSKQDGSHLLVHTQVLIPAFTAEILYENQNLNHAQLTNKLQQTL